VNNFAPYLRLLAEGPFQATEHVLIAHLGEKIIRHYLHTKPRAEYPFSFSRRPPSCVQDSLGTPWGLHCVAAKHGHSCPPGTVFVGREDTGQCYHQRADAGPDQPPLVTSRILRLRGLQQGLNAGHGIDSFDRMIYIHGTNFPEKFPQNISAGCLLLRDSDLLPLFDAIPCGSHVLILRAED
jgi:hypothetical protein